MRAVSRWFFSINQTSQSVPKGLSSICQSTSSSQSVQAKGKRLANSEKGNLASFNSSSLGMVYSYSFASLSIWCHSGHSIDTLGFVQKRWTDNDSLPSVKWIHFHLSFFLGSTREMFWIHVVSLNWSIPSPLGSECSRDRNALDVCPGNSNIS